MNSNPHSDRYFQEIREIPTRAHEAYEKTPAGCLPQGVPWLGMGSSYFAALALKFAGAEVFPEIASEFCYYLNSDRKPKNAVLISQSGRSSEVLGCADLVESFTAVVNAPDSPLARKSNCRQCLHLHAGMEVCSSTKTYVNTLITLYRGAGIDPWPAVDYIERCFPTFETWGREAANHFVRRMSAGPLTGITAIGSGPDLATANEIALTLGESIKRTVAALPLAQYDHGPKEAAPNSMLLWIEPSGELLGRARALKAQLRQAGAEIIEWRNEALDARLAPIANIVPFNFMTAYLVEMMDITETFILGKKITEGAADA